MVSKNVRAASGIDVQLITTLEASSGQVVRHRQEPVRFPLREGLHVTKTALKEPAHLRLSKLRHLPLDQHHCYDPTAHQTQE
jgi:hypothetical protein